MSTILTRDQTEGMDDMGEFACPAEAASACSEFLEDSEDCTPLTWKETLVFWLEAAAPGIFLLGVMSLVLWFKKP